MHSAIPMLPAHGAQLPEMDQERVEGARALEYLLVVYPEGKLRELLINEQQRFSEDYGKGEKGCSKPHILVGRFLAGEVLEETLIRWIQRICAGIRSFEVVLNNFSGFPPHTIYLRVLDPGPFQLLAEKLSAINDLIRSSGWPPPDLNHRPFLGIAGSLTEQVYQQAMPEYSGRDFHGSFRAGEMFLLKRDHAFGFCKTVNIFRFIPA